jgi:hypothetical protein
LSATISLTSAKTYGVERVCTMWEQPRSSFYAWRRSNNIDSAEPATPPQKRGPKTELSDTELLGKIQADLARSPFQGEGHRKVWARCVPLSRGESRPPSECERLFRRRLAVDAIPIPSADCWQAISLVSHSLLQQADDVGIGRII